MNLPGSGRVIKGPGGLSEAEDLYRGADDHDELRLSCYRVTLWLYSEQVTMWYELGDCKNELRLPHPFPSKHITRNNRLRPFPPLPPSPPSYVLYHPEKRREAVSVRLRQ